MIAKVNVNFSQDGELSESLPGSFNFLKREPAKESEMRGSAFQSLVWSLEFLLSSEVIRELREGEGSKEDKYDIKSFWSEFALQLVASMGDAPALSVEWRFLFALHILSGSPALVSIGREI